LTLLPERSNLPLTVWLVVEDGLVLVTVLEKLPFRAMRMLFRCPEFGPSNGFDRVSGPSGPEQVKSILALSTTLRPSPATPNTTGEPWEVVPDHLPPIGAALAVAGRWSSSAATARPSR